MSLQIDFTGKNVVVIGGTSGINLGIAETFAEHGARVAVASRSAAKVEAAVAQLQQYGGEVFGGTADVRDLEALQALFKQFQQQLGEIDVLVSGAAGNFPAAAMQMSANGFKSVMDIDLLGTFQVMQTAYPYLRRPDASVINISAPQAFIPMPLQVHVCAAKAGVDMVTRVLAMEWGASGVRINSIVPGPIAGTEGMKRLAPSAALQAKVSESVPLKRQGTPQDIAHTALFLASPLASYITGAVIPVDGGWSTGGVSTMMHELADVLNPQ